MSNLSSRITAGDCFQSDQLCWQSVDGSLAESAGAHRACCLYIGQQYSTSPPACFGMLAAGTGLCLESFSSLLALDPYEFMLKETVCMNLPDERMIAS